MAWRYALAFVLSFVIIIGWNMLFPPKPPVRRPEGDRVAEQGPDARRVAPPKDEKQGEGPEPSPVEAEPSRIVRERKTETVDLLDRFELLADSFGGRISKVSLKEYRETIDDEESYTLLSPPAAGFGTLGVSFEFPEAQGSAIPWDENWELEVDRDNARDPKIRFSNEVGSIRIRKIIGPGAPSDVESLEAAGSDKPVHHLSVRVEVENVSSEAQEIHYTLYGPAGIDSESLGGAAGSDVQLAIGAYDSSGKILVDLVAPGKMVGGVWERPQGSAWVGLTNNYFASMLFPLSERRGESRPRFVAKAIAEAYPDPVSVREKALAKFGKEPELLDAVTLQSLRESATKNIRSGLRSVAITLEPHQTLVHEYGLFLGPREADILDEYQTLNLKDVNQYGVFSILVKFFIWTLGALHWVSFQSWGAAIILLTLLVKLCLHPINKKSQGSMQRFQKKMQKVKPEMDALKEKFATNRAKMNQEMQKLWKEHGINPGQQMAGCLILLLQLPIWWGLYSTLQYAIGLRQAGFLYIADLTRPDQAFPFLNVQLPILGNMFTYFNVLPVLYVILTVVNQRLQPKPADPQMQAQFKMMTFMMVFFGFIFYNFPAGFMLYIMTSAALGIVESKIIKAELAREEASGTQLATAEAGDVPGSGAMYRVQSRRKPDDAQGRGKRGKHRGRW